MPYLPQQHRLFEAIANSPALAKAKGIPQAQAQKMAHKGVKPQMLAKAIRSKK